MVSGSPKFLFARPAMMNPLPSLASAVAMDSPIPEVEPEMSAVFPANCKFTCRYSLDTSQLKNAYVMVDTRAESKVHKPHHFFRITPAVGDAPGRDFIDAL